MKTKVRTMVIMVLGVIYFSFVLMMTLCLLNRNDYGVTEFGMTSLILITEETSLNNYQQGDLVLVTSKKIKNLKVGSEVFVYQRDRTGKINFDNGYIKAIDEHQRLIMLEDGLGYVHEHILGVPVKVYHGLGSCLTIILSQWGFFFCILLPVFLIFIYEIYALVLVLKYGKVKS